MPRTHYERYFWWLAGLSTTLLGLACGGKTEKPARNRSDTEVGCKKSLGERPLVHACTHATNGRFESVIAAPDVDESHPTNEVHVTYLVELSNLERGGYVKFSPSRDGEHLLLFDQEVDVQLGSGGEVADATFAGPVEDCDALTYGVVYDVSAGSTYWLSVAAAQFTPVVLFFEHLQTFGDEAWDECLEDE